MFVLVPGLLNDSKLRETFINDRRRVFRCLASVLILILSKSWAKCKSNTSRFFRTNKWPRGVEAVGW